MTTLETRIDRHRHMLKRVENFIQKGAVMAYEITLNDTEPVDVIGTTYTTSPESIGAETGPAYHRIYDALGKAGITPAGPPRLVYHDMADQWTVEACVPVAGRATAT